MSGESMTFILVIAVVGCSRVLAVVGFLGLTHKLNQSDAGMDTARPVGVPVRPLPGEEQ